MDKKTQTFGEAYIGNSGEPQNGFDHNLRAAENAGADIVDVLHGLQDERGVAEMELLSLEIDNTIAETKKLLDRVRGCFYMYAAKRLENGDSER